VLELGVEIRRERVRSVGWRWRSRGWCSVTGRGGGEGLSSSESEA
jgi:hypothetical protein